MKNLRDGNLRRVVVDESDDEDDISLGNLSEEDLSDSENEASADDEEGIQNGLAEIPFGTLVQAQSRLKSDTRPDKGKTRQPRDETSRRGGDDQDTRERKQLKRKRENKHAPTEMSSKKKVGRSREAVEVVKIERRDPRFDPDMTSQKTQQGYTRRAYGFLEDYRKDEMRLLKQSIAKEKNEAVRAGMEKTLKSMQSREQASKERERRQRVLSEHKKKEQAAAKEGKVPYHLKESEKNKLYLKDKYDSLKDTKGLKKFMAKKAKRRSQKDKRALPI